MTQTQGTENGGSGGDGQGQEDRLSKAEVSEILSRRVNELNVKHEAELKALQPKQKVYTRSELNAAVQAGTIGEADAQAIFDAQQTKQAEETAQRVAVQTVTNLRQTDNQQETIDKYTKFDPDLQVSGTKSRQRIESEIHSQMKIFGQTEPTLATEVAALRQVYGPAEKLGQSSEKDREFHQEINSGADPIINQDGTPKGLSKREKAHYQKQVDKGMITWEGVGEELKYANPNMRARHRS